LGIQIDLSRDTATSAAMPGRLRSIQLMPRALYSLGDHVSDFVWVRPYFGVGAGLVRQTLTPIPNGSATLSDDGVGFQVFGGGEFTFASVPQFALSADLGYRNARTPFAGFDIGGVGVSLSGHWYVK
jgi:hypothetical protein